MSNNNSMVAHLWANQKKTGARSNNGNFWFEGDTIYSYRTPIAKLHTIKGTIVALIDCEGYSNTTRGKHKPAIYRALNYRGFSVPSIGARGGQSRHSDELDHKANEAHFLKQYRDALEAWRRSWDSNSAPARRALEVLGDYCAAFGLAAPRIDIELDCDKVIADRAARFEKHNTPEAIAKRAKAKAARDAKAARQAEIARLAEAERAVLWLKGETDHYRTNYGIPALLRVKGDELQTSQGATVPLDHAKRAFTFIAACRAHGKTFETNGHRIAVGHFQIDSIDAEGNVRAGCHLIAWPEIERIAKQLELV